MGGVNRYWLGLFGGAVAWLAHLMLSYALAEFGCESVLATYSLLGINAVACGLLALTLLMVGGAVGAALLAYQIHPSGRGERETPDLVARIYAARAGLIANIAFTVVILFESVPILYYLWRCG